MTTEATTEQQLATIPITYPGNLPRDVWGIIFALVLADDLINQTGNTVSLGETCRALYLIFNHINKRDLFRRLTPKQIEHKNRQLIAWQENERSYAFLSSSAAQSLVDIFDLCSIVFNHAELTGDQKLAFISRLKRISLEPENAFGFSQRTSIRQELVRKLPQLDALQAAMVQPFPHGKKESLETIRASERTYTYLQEILDSFIKYLYLSEGKKPDGTPSISKDILRAIFSWLTEPRDVFAFALTCRSFYDAYIASDNRGRYMTYMRQTLIPGCINANFYSASEELLKASVFVIFETCSQLSLLERSNAEKIKWFAAMRHAVENKLPATSNLTLLQHALNQMVQAEKIPFKSDAVTNTLKLIKTLLDLFVEISQCPDNLSRNRALLKGMQLLKKTRVDYALLLHLRTSYENPVAKLIQGLLLFIFPSIPALDYVALCDITYRSLLHGLLFPTSIFTNTLPTEYFRRLAFWSGEPSQEAVVEITLPEITLPSFTAQPH